MNHSSLKKEREMANIGWNRIREGHTEAEAKAAITVAELEEIVIGLGFYCPKCEHLMMDKMPPKIKQARTLEEIRAIKACGRCLSGESDGKGIKVISAKKGTP